jgi:hypothetical protein
VHERDPIAEVPKRLASPDERVGITIEPDQPFRTSLEQRTRVPSKAHGAIDEDAASRWRQVLEHLGHHHRFVH